MFDKIKAALVLEKDLFELSHQEPKSKDLARRRCALVGKITGIIEDDGAFSVTQSYFFSSGNQAWHLSPILIANILIKLLDKGESISGAIQKVERLLTFKSATFYLVKIVRGVQCDEKQAVNDDVSIMPIEDLPDSNNKKRVLDEIANEKRGAFIPDYLGVRGLLPVSMFPHRRAGEPKFAALVQEYVVESLIYQCDKNTEDIEQKIVGNDAYIRAYNNLDEIILLLNLSGVCAATEEINWSQCKDEFIDSFEILGNGIGFPTSNFKLERKMISEPVKIENISHVISDFKNIRDGDFKNKIRNALEHLSKGLNVEYTHDKALEYCIALECALLTEEKGDNFFKTALRSALIYDGSFEEKKQVRNVIKELYSIRSKLVHKGEKTTFRTPNITIENIESIIIHIISQLILKPNPDWSKLEIVRS